MFDSLKPDIASLGAEAIGNRMLTIGELGAI
jgi:hypothetical protein